MTQKESEIAMGRGGIGCELLPGQGSFYTIIGGGRVQRIQSYLIEGEELDRAVGAINQRWAGCEPYRIEMLESGAATPATSQPATSIDELNAARILEHYEPSDLLDDAGNARKGMQLAAVRILFGADAENAGTPRRTTVRALEVVKKRMTAAG